MPEAEPPPQPSSLPIVPSEVTNRLLEPLSLDVVHVSPEKMLPHEATDSFTAEVLSDLINSNKKLAETVNNVTNENYSYLDADSALKGMAIVLKVYDHMTEFDLMLRLNSLQPDDINLAKQTLEQSFPPKNQTVTILQQLLTLPRIPEQQIDLNQLLGKAKKYLASGKPSFERGAAAMYKTLEVLWPKLYPPQTPPQTPPQQPTIQ